MVSGIAGRTRPDKVKKRTGLQQTIFDEYIHVDGDTSKAEKVIRSIRRDISDEAYLYVYYASLSDEEDALQAIYQFLRVGFATGSSVLEQYANPSVMRIVELPEKSWKRMSSFPGICTI